MTHSVQYIYKLTYRKQETGYVVEEGLNWRLKNFLNCMLAPVATGQGTIGLVQGIRDFSLVTSFVEFELFESHPEPFFLIADGFLSLNEFLLFQFDPLLIKPEALLDFSHPTMEVLQEEELFLMRNPCCIEFLAGIDYFFDRGSIPCFPRLV